MEELQEIKNKANELRKAKNFTEALPLYITLWEKPGDSFDGAGLLSCLRNLKKNDEALKLASEIIEKYPNDHWCQLETIWTYIKTELNQFPDNSPLETVLRSAKKIIGLNPQDLALRSVVFKVLKFIKKHNRWELAEEWLERINPNDLDEKPIAETFGPRGWSYKVLWYNYKLKFLLEKGNFEEVIKLTDEISEKFPNQKKYILRFKATAFYRLKRLDESVAIYSELTRGFKVDWWLLHEYALVLKDKNRKTEALTLMFRAASSNSKLQLMVTSFAEIGFLLREMNRNEEALAHLLLSKYVREENGWKTSQELESSISELTKTVSPDFKISSTREALSYCKNSWLKESGEKNPKDSDVRKIKKGLNGNVKFGPENKPFCFIYCSDKESYFCNKSNLPKGLLEGESVYFDAIPSFDEKKGKESWKASNVRKNK